MKKIFFLCTILLGRSTLQGMQQDPLILGSIFLIGHKETFEHVKRIFQTVPLTPVLKRSSRSFEKNLDQLTIPGHKKSNSVPDKISLSSITAAAFKETMSKREKIPEVSPEIAPIGKHYTRRNAKDFTAMRQKLLKNRDSKISMVKEKNAADAFPIKESFESPTVLDDIREE